MSATSAALSASGAASRRAREPSPSRAPRSPYVVALRLGPIAAPLLLQACS